MLFFMSKFLDGVTSFPFDVLMCLIDRVSMFTDLVLGIIELYEEALYKGYSYVLCS